MKSSRVFALRFTSVKLPHTQRAVSSHGLDMSVFPLMLLQPPRGPPVNHNALGPLGTFMAPEAHTQDETLRRKGHMRVISKDTWGSA